MRTKEEFEEYVKNEINPKLPRIHQINQEGIDFLWKNKGVGVISNLHSHPFAGIYLNLMDEMKTESIWSVKDESGNKIEVHCGPNVFCFYLNSQSLGTFYPCR